MLVSEFRGVFQARNAEHVSVADFSGQCYINMIGSVIEDCDIRRICIEDGESRILGRIYDGALLLEDFALLEAGIEVVQEFFFMKEEFVNGVFNLGFVEVLGHEFNRVAVKGKRVFVIVFEDLGAELLEFIEDGFAREGGVRLGDLFVGRFMFAVAVCP